MPRADRATARAHCLALLSLVLACAGCSHMPHPHWPWHPKAAPESQEVHELIIETGSTPSTFHQYWKRNTLLVDLSGASSTGSLILERREGADWPVRIAFRMVPGQVGILEVRAAQRVVLPVTAQGSQPVDLELAPGVYTRKTTAITVSWGPPEAPPT
ncbi:MAG TPA: hypothetical protein VJQ47_06310 [Steroidobacteraceae bacterium]|nr:hypothetical protein [Steroidobacteraceae bacterium]